MSFGQFLIAIALWCSGSATDYKSQCQQRLLQCWHGTTDQVIECFRKEGKL